MDLFTSLIYIFIVNVNIIISEFIFMLVRMLGFNIFKTKATTQSTITKIILNSFYTRYQKGLPFGLIICYTWEHPFIGYATCGTAFNYNRHGTLNIDIDVICTEKIWNKINSINKISDLDTNIYMYNGSSLGDMRSVPMKKLIPWPSQQKIMNAILHTYHNNKFASVIISGDTCTGKSIVAYLLAQKLKTIITTNTMFYRSSDMDNLICSNEPSFDSPVICLFDEFDQIVNFADMSTKKIDMPNSIFMKSLKGSDSANVIGKKEWNEGLDRFSIGLYPFIIWIFTTNKSREEIEQGDKSVFRSGRINLFINTNINPRDNSCIDVTILDQDTKFNNIEY